MNEVIGIKSIKEPLLFTIFGAIFSICGITLIISFIISNGLVIPVIAMLCIGILFALLVTFYGIKLLRRPKDLIILANSTLFLTEENKEILLGDIASVEVYYRNPNKKYSKTAMNGVEIKIKNGSFFHVPQLRDPIYVVKTINEKLKI